MPSVTTSPPRVLVIGGSYGGLPVALNLLDLCRGKPARAATYSKSVVGSERPKVPVEISIVDKRDGFMHLIGSPLALASQTSAEQMSVKFCDIPALQTPEIECIHGSVASIDCKNKSAIVRSSVSGKESVRSYDYLVVTSGMRRDWPTVSQALTREKHLAEVSWNIEAVRNAEHGVVVIGGGAVGIGMAAEIKLVHPTQTVTLIHSRSRLLSNEPFPNEFKDRSLLVLKEAGVEALLGHRVKKSTPIGSHYELEFNNGTKMKAGHVIWAISNGHPSTSFLPKATLNEEGFIKINNRLSFSSHSSHFAIGDVAQWSGIKRCGGAMHMGPAAAANIHQSILHEESGFEPKWIEYPEHENVLALAVETQVVLYAPKSGLSWGVKEMEQLFGSDLGFSQCWNHMRLGESAGEE